jgi:hypothetical protein
MPKIQCLNCDKDIANPLILDKDGKVIKAEFCTRSCYIKYWHGYKNFKPLKNQPKGKNNA